MATVTFSISKSPDDLGRAEVMIRFSVSRTKRYRVKSNIFVPVNRWSKKNEISIPKIETQERKNLLTLDSKIKSLKEFLLNKFEDADKELISKEWVLECIDRFHYPEKYEIQLNPFFETFETFLSLRKISAVRIRNFRVLERCLKRYELYKSLSIPNFRLVLKNIDFRALRDFEDYLAIETKIFKKHPQIFKQVKESRTPEKRSQNTIVDLMVKFRTFMIWCNDNELIEINPFKKYTLNECVYGTPYYITIKERNQIYNHDFSDVPKLEIQRDIFVFQCLIGCRVSDLFKFKRDNIIDGAVEYIARKTKDGNPLTVRIPLNHMAKEIIDKYKDYPCKGLFPFISEQKYNIAIKEIFTIAGIVRIVTILDPKSRTQKQVPLNQIASSHLARRTFIGNLYKQVKDPNLVGSMSGHKEGSKAFARYRDIDDEIKTDLMNLLL